MVTFDPTVAGVRNGTLLITTSAGLQAIGLTGNGTVTPPPAPHASLPAGPIDFGHVTVGESVSTPHVTLTNTGLAPLDVTSISITGSGAFTVDAGQCSASIAINGTCDIVVTLSPTSTGARSATLHVSSDGGNPTVALSGNGDAPTAPAASLSPSSWSFTIDPTPGTDTKTFTLTNSGTASLHVGTAALTGSGHFSIAAPADDTCSSHTVTPGNSCTIKITFTANAAADKNGTLSVPSDATNGTVSAALTGTATAPAVSSAQLTPSSRDYGDVVVGNTKVKTFIVTNTGTANLTGITVVLTNHTTFTKTTDACSGAVTPGSTCTFDITFTPTNATHSSDTITVSSNASNGAQMADVLGDGVTATTNPVSQVSPDDWTYDPTVAGGHQDKDLTLKNNGTGTLTGIALSTTGSNFSIHAEDCPTSLTAGATCTITVRFAPTTVGDKSGTLKVVSDNAANGNVVVPLDGISTTPPSSVDVSPSPYDFGQVERGVTVNHTFTFHNTGGTSVHVVSVDKAAGSGAFTIPSGNDACTGATVAAGATCTFRVNFLAPTTNDVKTARVDVSGSGFPTVSVDLSGQGVPFAAKVDAYISKKTNAASDYVGQGVFCAAICSQQSVSQNVKQGKNFTYRVKIKNVGNGIDSIKARLTQGGSKAIIKSIKVLLNGNTDVTSKFVNGGYTIKSVHPGAYAYFWVTVTLTPNAHIGNTNAIVVTGQSIRQSAVKDVVQGKSTATAN